MSGHSKWATIKRKKAAIDAKRGKVFTRVLREIQVAARLGGAAIESNPRLRTAVTAAKEVSMPWDNIERAIKRGTGDLEGVQYEEAVYEGYGPGGVAILVKALTDNKNRTASEIRSIFTHAGANLAAANAVSYLFKEQGQILVKKEGVNEDELFTKALENQADDISDFQDSWLLTCDPHNVQNLRQVLEKITSNLSTEIIMMPSTTVRVEGEQAETLQRLLNNLDEHDDVQNVWTNSVFENNVSEDNVSEE